MSPRTREQRQYGEPGTLVFVPAQDDQDSPDGRWIIRDRPGHRDDFTVHNGQFISVRWKGRWIDVYAESNGETWLFQRPNGYAIELKEKIAARQRLV